MIFSCWGSFQREVFWLKLTLYYAQVMTMLTTTVMMMLMLLMFMRSDSYRDGDDVEVDDFIWYIFTIWCKTGGGMNAPNWIFTHLKFQKKRMHCQCAVLYLHCNALFFFRHILQMKSVLQMHAQKDNQVYKCNSCFRHDPSVLRTQQRRNVLTHWMDNRMYE